jgi:phosphohistidine swiveling domain-containing protein
VVDNPTRLARGEQWPLLASLIASGLRRQPFEAATGLPFGTEHVRHDGDAHILAEGDVTQLRAAVAELAGSPGFAGDYIGACSARGDRLLTTARSVSRLAAEPHRTDELAEAFAAFAEATQGAAPFLVATPAVLGAFEAVVAGRIAEEPGRIPDPAQAAQALRHLLNRSAEPAPLRELRDFYRMVAAVMDDASALKILQSTSPAVAMNRLHAEFPALYELMRDHAKAYAWLGARGTAHVCEARPPKELVERLQVVVLRWKPDRVEQAAARRSAPDPAEALGFTPPEPLGTQIAALQRLAALPAARIDVHLLANCLATAFFTAVADVLGCTREQVLFGAAAEVAGALAGRHELPLAEIDRRIAEREPESPAAPLTGMTASRGRAIGTVRVILAAPQVHKLEAGDVLVTATSTPDAMGGESVFPTRAGPPLGIENATAIVTDEGGSLSHAAIVAREQGIPCIVGTEHATSLLTDGQVVEIDATAAVGRIIPLT